MQEFTNSTGWKIFYCAIAVFLFAFSMFLFSMDHSRAGNIVLVIPVFLAGLAILIVVSQFRRKIIISVDTILRINAFGTKKLPVADVKGCRIGEKFIAIESLTNGRITINNYQDLAYSDDLVKWLKENFKDLDAVDLKEEENKALNDTTLGATQKEREEKIKKAGQKAWTYNIVGMLLMFVLIFLKENTTVAIISISFPLFGILIIIFSNGLIKFVSNSKRSVNSFIMLGFAMPSFIMLIRSLFDYNIYQYSNIWLPFIGCTLITTCLLYFFGINKAITSIAGQIIGMLIVSSIYAYGATVQLNCTFDKSQPQPIRTLVFNKWIEYNKGSHYHLRLVSWDDDVKPKDIEVSISTFKRYSTGNNINVNLKKGLLNVPWYYLAQ